MSSPQSRESPAGRRSARRRPWRARLRHFRSPRDLFTFACVGFELEVMALGLRLFGLPRLLAWAADGPRTLDPTDGGSGIATARPVLEGEQLARFVDFWLRSRNPPNPCLRRSLVLFRRFRRAGVPVRFCLGVRADGVPEGEAPVEGHAWLEHSGNAFLEPAGQSLPHVLTYAYPRSREDSSGSEVTRLA